MTALSSPTLAVGGRGGSTVSPTGPANRVAKLSTGDFFMNSLNGPTRNQLGPLVHASSKTWTDLDLFEVHANNYAILSDLLVFNISASAGVSNLTGHAAPRVHVPNNTNTFKGRTFEYNVFPATDVPKRGTVRIMSKTVKEWEANMTQKGIGTFIEGGAYRTSEGTAFLLQESRAFAMSFELNMAINTAMTLVNAAIARPFFLNPKPNINATTFSHQIQREIETFCCGCGDSQRLMQVLIGTQKTTPNVDTVYMTMATAQALTINDRGPQTILPNQALTMISDSANSKGQKFVRVQSKQGIKTLFSILGGKLNVLPMATFNFNEGKDAYQPLQHAFTAGEWMILGAERGMKGWHETQPTSTENNPYHQKALSIWPYSHPDDQRVQLDFLDALAYARIFGEHKSEFLSVLTRTRYLYHSNLIKFLGDFNGSWFNQRGKSDQQFGSMMVSYANWDNDEMESVIIDSANHKIHNSISYHDAVQSFKRCVQFPLTTSTRYNSASSAARGIFNKDGTNKHLQFVLPDKIGDTDPMHITPNLFRCMHSDVKKELQQGEANLPSLLECPEYSQLVELREILTRRGSFDPHYWELVRIQNTPVFADGKIKKSNYNNGTIGAQIGIVRNIADTSTKSQAMEFVDFPLSESQEIPRIPTFDDYKKHLITKGIPVTISAKDFVPQGLWSIPGLRYLANSSGVMYDNRLGQLARGALNYLQHLWCSLSKIFPNTIYTNCGSPDHLAFFSNYGNVYSTLNGSSVDESNGLQILLNLLDDPSRPQFIVSMNSPSEGIPASYRQTEDKKTTSYSTMNVDSSFLLSNDLVQVRWSDQPNPNTWAFFVETKDVQFSLTLNKMTNEMSGAQNVTHRWMHALIILAMNMNDIKLKNTTALVARARSIYTKLTQLEPKQFDSNTFSLTVAQYAGLKDYLLGKSNSPEPSSGFKVGPPNAGTELKEDGIIIRTLETLVLLFGLYSNYRVHLIPAIDGVTDLTTEGNVVALKETINPNSKNESGSISLAALIESLTKSYSATLLSFKILNFNIPQPLKMLVPGSSPPKRDVIKKINYLTPFVLYHEHLPPNYDYTDILTVHDRFSITVDHSINIVNSATNRNEDLMAIYRAHVLYGPAFHSHWFEMRYNAFVGKKAGSVHKWSNLDRAISAFILSTQWSMASTTAMVHKNIRPGFEIVAWRPFIQQMFEGILLLKAGLATAMNPWANAHIGMSCDATTDQYQVRAVMETDCVVISNQNLAFVPNVKPVSYLGGRGARWVYDPKDIIDTSNSLEKSPSLIATVVSDGYMRTTEDPVSFIGTNVGKLDQNYNDEPTKHQMWPGIEYYGKTIYRMLFHEAAKSYSASGNSNSNSAQQKFAVWLGQQKAFNHICFRANVLIWDPNTGRYTQSISGNGHYGADHYNSRGAKDVFSGKTTTFIMNLQERTNMS